MNLRPITPNITIKRKIILMIDLNSPKIIIPSKIMLKYPIAPKLHKQYLMVFFLKF